MTSETTDSLTTTEGKLVHKGNIEKLLTHCVQGGHWLAAPRERIPFQQILNSSVFREDGLPNDSFFLPARLEQRTKMVNIVKTYQLIS
ncbi:hypothetical protein [Halomonas mongoliensis]|uniref:hypothetical protein n=1 Tax=Halomonas mongoliensis TaxID=321265 RepID=UPI00403ABC4B